MDQYDMSAALPVQREIFNQQGFSRARSFTNSTNLDYLFNSTPVAPTATPLSPLKSDVSYVPQNVSHERSSISHGPSHAYQSHPSIYGSPIPSAVSQGQPLCTASQPSSPYESRSSSVSAGRFPVRPGTDSPTSNQLPITRAFSVTSQPVKTVSIIEDTFARPSPNSMKSYQQQQQDNQWHSQQNQQKYQHQHQHILREQQNNALQISDASHMDEYPLRVVGKQGIRGILPSVCDGAELNPEKLQPVLAKDKNGKYPCLHCQKTYLHAKHLKRHLLRHLGIRPYACYLCRDTFSRSDILKRHFQKCSQRRGNPGGQDHLAEKRRKNRSYSTMEGSLRSTNRSASGSGEVSYGSSARSLSSLANTTATTGPRSSIQSLSTSSSRSSSLLRAGNDSETGRKMSSVEFINQQQQQQQRQKQQQPPPPRGTIGYQSVSAMSDFSFPSTSTTNSSTGLVESLAAYSLPRDRYKSGDITTPLVYNLNSSVLNADATSHTPSTTSHEFMNNSSEVNEHSQRQQGVARTNMLNESGLDRRSATNSIAEHFPENKEQATEERSHQKYQQKQLSQNSILCSASGTAVNTDGTAITPFTGSSYRPRSDTHATPALTGVGTPSPLPSDVEERAAWPSLSSISCVTPTQAMLAPQRHASQPQNHFNYGYRYQSYEEQQQQQQQRGREQEQQQQQYLIPEQHHYYQHQMSPYELDAQMRSEILSYDR